MKASKAEVHGEPRIRVDFQYSRETNSKIRQVKGARWDPEIKAWHPRRSVGPTDIGPDAEGSNGHHLYQGVEVQSMGRKAIFLGGSALPR